MKTGVIITAEIDKDNKLDDIHLKYVYDNKEPENWRHPDKNPNPVDVQHYMDIMSEGMISAMYYLKDNTEKTDAEILRETIKKLEDAFIRPSEFGTTQIEKTETIQGSDVL